MHLASPLAADRPGGRTPAVLLLLYAVLGLIVLAHHPVVRGGHDPAALRADIAALAGVDRAVHGTLMVLAGLQLLALALFALRRGAGRATVLAGLIAQATAFAATLLAATLDGFVVPALAAGPAAGAAAPDGAFVPLLGACAAAIQVVTAIALIAGAIAMGAWSLDLVRRGPGRAHAVGGIGLAAAVVSLGVLGGLGRIDVHGLIAVVLVQDAWYLALAWLLWRDEA